MKTKIKTLIIIGSLACFAGAAKAEDAAANWSAKCASCHGKDGTGNTLMGKKNGVKDYTDPKVQAELTDEKAADAIKNGVVVDGKQKMKAFGDKFTTEEITALVAQVRQFKK